MKIEKINIDYIPALLWGEKSEKCFIAVHGSMSSKSDKFIEILANTVAGFGYQVLSFDLPEHGERKENKTYLCNAQNAVKDLSLVLSFAKSIFSEISVFGCSVGAYFSMLAYKNEKIKQFVFLSPIVDMQSLIEDMMKSAKVTEQELKAKKIIETSFHQTLYYDYYKFIKDNPVSNFKNKVFILYGNEDNLQSESLVKNFAESNDALIEIVDSEHYFHTKNQLDEYTKFLEKVLNNEN